MSKPKRDANVTDIEPVRKESEVAAPASPKSDDVLMPTVENEPSVVFRPEAGCAILDVYEIALMTLLVLQGNNIQFPAGALRDIQVPAEKAALLSTSARRFMKPVTPPASPASADTPNS